MRTQQLKNGLIVPVGAKGGFVLKRSGLSPSEARKLADEQYRVFVASLLDLTDNLDATGRVLPPANVVRRDGDDPYLVVAADKGTAHLSDAANAIATARDFWLGDAFASGGSEATTTRSSRSPPAARGNVRSSISPNWASIPNAMSSRPPASATCRATYSATARC